MCQAFIEAFTECTEGMQAISSGWCAGCPECQRDLGMTEAVMEAALSSGELPNEPYFTWSGCDTCGCTLGGSREPGHAIVNGEIVHFQMCVDCILYVANGDLPERWCE